MSYQSDVREFMVLGGQTVRTEFPELRRCESDVSLIAETMRLARFVAAHRNTYSVAPSDAWLSARLIVEEVSELVSALWSGNQVEVADAVVDAVYILLGIANRYGFDFDAGFREVQSANMRKFPNGVATRDDSGKIQKPVGWVGPDPAKLILPYGGS